MILRTGSNGAVVVAVQKALGAHGFRVRPDGDFGAETEDAVKQFQATHNLEVDGVVGPNTLGELVAGPGAKYRDALQLQKKEAIPAGVAGLQRRVLEVAMMDLGKQEQPLGSNRGPAINHLVDGYADYWSIPNRPYLAWCGMAVMVWTGKALRLGSTGRDMRWKQHPIGGKFLGGVAQISDWAEKEGVARPARDAVPGDIFTMLRGGSGSDASKSTRAGHTGIVVRRNADHLITIDGNVSDGVHLRTRPISSLQTTIRWYERA